MNFKRKNSRGHERRKDGWDSWVHDSLIKRIWRQSHGLPKLKKGDKGYEEEQRLWEEYLKKEFGNRGQ